MLDNFIYRKNTTDENVIKEILTKQAYKKKKLNFIKKINHLLNGKKLLKRI